MPNPDSPEEWQNTANAADLMLLIDSAVQYGMVEYENGHVDVDRCIELLQKAAMLGIFPQTRDGRRRWVGWWVRAERITLGWSQRLLAARIGKSSPWISMVENEKVDVGDDLMTKFRDIFTNPD